jgi:hypothetical protein
MAQFPQRLCLNLADAFPGDCERLANFFERVLAAVFQPKTHLNDLFFARCQRPQHLRSLVFEVDVDHRFGRRNHRTVFDEVAQMRIFLFADRRFERDWLLRNLQTLRTFATGMSMRLAISSDVGSRPSSCTSCREVRISLLIVSIMCTGIRIVRA